MRLPRLVLVLPVAVLALAGCGGDDDAAEPTSTTAPSTVASSSTTAASVTTAATASTAPATPATTAASGPHVVQHAMGETEVPADPQRVVVLDSSFLDASIALGVIPAGATEGTPGAGLPAYLGEATADIQLAGDTTTPNLELIASLQPDLILAAKVRHEALYEQLSSIAPTVFSESSGQNWTDQVRLTGDALGRTAEADALVADFEARATAVGAAIGATGKTASIVRFIPGQTRLYGPTTFSGSVLTAVGFDLGDKGYDPAVGMALLSAEQLEMVDADVIFATTFAGEGSARPDFEALWANLPAVGEGRQFDVEDSTWMSGIGVLGANQILDDLEAWLA
jgi:ABC-type Fe3+-hydroxamate transport system substrate-binding protein